MRIDILTIFPDFFFGFLGDSLIKKGMEKEKAEIKIWDIRNFTNNKHKAVDDKPFGGGRGMVLKIEPIYNCLEQIKKETNFRKRKIVLLTPRGKKFNQKKAAIYSESKHLIIICGRYEGVDERVAKKLVDEKISIGNFVLMGGEAGAMAIVEAVVRLLPGFVGKSEELRERITKEGGFAEYPQYTRPEKFNNWKVPKVLMEGNHKKIKEWRKKHTKTID